MDDWKTYQMPWGGPNGKGEETVPTALSVTYQGASWRRLVVLVAVLAVAVGGLVAAGPSARAAVSSTQQVKLTAADATADDRFGVSVAISGDTVVVGAVFDDDAGLSSGSAYVFVRSGTTWSEQAKLTASDATAFDFFGFSVAISGDTALVGAENDDDAGPQSGSAYVFTRSGATWTQQAKLTAADATADDQFGFSVAISGDTALVGVHFDDDAGPSSGSAYVFTRSGATWIQQAKLTAADAAAFDEFGVSVAISDDTAVVGAHFDGDAGFVSGSAYVFTRSGATWIQQAKLTASDAAGGNRFGASVVISGDTVVVGAASDDDAGDRSGSAYVFALANGAPTSDPGGPYAVVEGSSVLLNGSGSSDPDSDALTFDWSPGTFLDNPSSATPTFTGIDDGVEGLTLTVTDPGGLSDAAGTTVTVTNADPVITSISATVDPVQVGTDLASASATFTDPGTLDTHTAVWDWGDFTTSPGTVDEALGTVTGAHIYDTPGVYTVTLTLTDDDGGSDTAELQFVVAYDPSGGFVTGGGWIDSPPGACTLTTACEGATGKANFGFASKYKKGANVPTGQAEFQFKAGNLNFHSTEYEWLVVAGASAKFKGSGSINGAGDFGFLLTAIDGQIDGGGGVDKFRIKIVDKTSDVVVYDNKRGEADDSDAATALGGGSIIIHKK
ncbi:MAG: PKD domain-containing protein [Actinobacteria bacterium]|nr:PKD domain-containing protein [Actinomycetota bacterium]